MVQTKNKSYFNYLYIAIIILRSPLQGTILTFDGKGRIILILTLIAFFLNINKSQFKRLFFSRPIVLWFIWCIYAIANTYIKGYSNADTSFTYFAINQILCPCVLMTICAYEYMNSSATFLKTLLYIFLTYAFIGAYIMDINYIAEAEGILEKNTLGNALALNVIMIAFFTGVLYCRKELTLKVTVILILLTVGIVVMSATRKALGAVAIMIIALIFSTAKFTYERFVKLILPIIVLYVGFTYIMENTQMGERLSSLEEQTANVEMKYDVGDSFFLKAVGDRAPQYIIGTEIFKQYPISGIGLTNFIKVSKYPFRLHTEYMVQLCECGIIGFALFIIFYANIILNLFKKIKTGNEGKEMSIMMLGGIVSLLFLYLTTWSYNISTYFAVIGTVIGYIKLNMKYDKNWYTREKEFLQ